MNETERNNTNAATALHGAAPYMLGGLALRRISPESLGVLERIGSPLAALFAASLNGGQKPAVAMSANDVLAFIWAHGADADEVLATAMLCSPAYADPAAEAALRFAREHVTTPEAMAEAVQYIAYGDKELEAAAFQAHAPDFGSGPHAKKNF